MKLMHLGLGVAVLGAGAAALWYFTQPKSPTASPTASATGTALAVGQPLVPTEAVGKASRVELFASGATTPSVVVERDSTGGWILPEYHRLPADFDKLRNFVRSLSEAKVDREVTRNPERLATLGLDQNRVVLREAGGGTVVDLQVGRTGTSGGNFVRPAGDGQPAFLLTQGLWLDGTQNNWASRQPLAIKADEVQEFTVSFGDGSAPLTVRRATTGADFAAEGLAEGETLKSDDLKRLLDNLLQARFTEVQTNPAADEVTAAQSNARTFTLKTFAGETTTVRIGRRPAVEAAATTTSAAATSATTATASTAATGATTTTRTDAEGKPVVEAYTPPIAVIPGKDGGEPQVIVDPTEEQIREIMANAQQSAPGQTDAATATTALGGTPDTSPNTPLPPIKEALAEAVTTGEVTPAAANPAAWVEQKVAATDATTTATPPAPTPVPAGPVYFFYELGSASSPWRDPLSRLALQFPEWIYTGLPANRAALVNPAPAPTPTTTEAAPTPAP